MTARDDYPTLANHALGKREEADTERLPADPVIAWIGGVAIIHGERDDSEMCLCGAPDYLTCPDWIAGNGTVSSLTFTSATCYYSLGHRNRHQCDCVCVRPAGHDGPHQCSAEAVRP